MRLGDLTEQALAAVGITPERVERWLGAECYCKERQAKLNSLGFWAKRVLSGKKEKAVEYLNTILEEQQDE